MTVLIGGGTGFIGRNLVKHLAKSNYEVIIVTRKPREKNHMSWEQIKTSGIPNGVEAVVNLSGLSVGLPFGYLFPRVKQLWFESRVGTNRILAKAIKEMKTPPELFCTMSGVGYYPPSETAVYAENGPNGEDWMGKLTKEWEMATILPKSLPVRTSVIRSGVVLGADGGIIKDLPLRCGVQLGSGQQFFPWIHMTDMVRSIEFIIQNKQLKGVFNGVAPECVTNKQFAKALTRDSYNKKRPMVFADDLTSTMPESIVKRVFGNEVSMMLLQGQNVVPTRLERSGFKFKYPNLKEALENIS